MLSNLLARLRPIDRLHALATKLHLSPQVFDPLAAAVGTAVVSWAKTGAFDGSEIAIALTGIGFALLGFAAPVLPKVDYSEAKVELGEKSRRRLASAKAAANRR